MWKILTKFITTLSLFSSFWSCAFFNRDTIKPNISPEFEQGKHLVAIGEYEKAEPWLLKTVVREDENYAQAVLLLGKVYDQLSMPEKSILNVRDFISKGGSPFDLLKAKALLLKNLAKVKISIENADEKKFITRIMTSKSHSTRQALEALRWTLDFKCSIYCVEEIEYLKEIQVQLLYATETDPSLFSRTFDILTSLYDYFETFLKDPKLNIEYRKKMAQGLYDALQKLKSSHLETGKIGSVKTAELINYLETYQKRIERWLYE